MKRFNLSIATALLTLVLSNHLSFALQMPMVAQTNLNHFCRDLLRQDQETEINLLESAAEQSINSGKRPQAIAQFRQAVELALVTTTPEFNKNFLSRALDSEGLLGGNTQVGRLVERATPAEKAQVVNLLDQLLRLNRSLSSGYSFVKTRSFAKLANFYRQLGQQSRAIEILNETLKASQLIKGAEFQTKALTELAQVHLLLGQPAPAEAILNQSLLFAQQIQTRDANRISWVLNPIAKLYAQIGRFDRSLSIARSIPAVYYRSEVQAEVASQALSRNQLDVAQTIIQAIESAEIKAKLLGSAAGQAAQSGQAARANALFTQALQLARTVNAPHEFTLAAVIQAYAQAGQPDVALRAAQQLKEAENKAFSLLSIATVYSQKNQIDHAVPLVDQVIAIVKEVDPNQAATNLPVALFEKALNDQQYRLAFEIARRFPVSPYTDSGEYLQKLAIAVVNAGQIDLALQAAQAISTNWVDYKSQAIRKIAIAYAQNNELDRALELVSQTENAGGSPYRVLTLASIAALTETFSDEIFKRAIAQANQLDTPQFRAQGLAFVARELINANKVAQAQPLVKQAIEIAKQDKDPSSVSYTLRTIVEQFLESNQYLTAFEVAETIPEAGDRGSKLSQILTSLLELGEIEKAFPIANAFKDSESRTWAFFDIAQAAVRSKQFDAAILTLNQAFQAAQNISDPESRTIQVREDLAVEDPRDRASSYEAIALLYAKAGRVEQGLQVAQRIQDPKLQESLQQRINCYRSFLSSGSS